MQPNMGMSGMNPNMMPFPQNFPVPVPQNQPQVPTNPEQRREFFGEALHNRISQDPRYASISE